jgi:hypothetical protein
VIDSIGLEHDWPPESRFALSANHAWASRPEKVLSAGVAELVDALDLGSSDESCGGSSPSARTILRAFPGESLSRTWFRSASIGTERLCRRGDDLIAAMAGRKRQAHPLSANLAIARIRTRACHSRFFSSARGLAGAAAGLSGILGAAGLISFARGGS